jgi:hypothetical protein
MVLDGFPSSPDHLALLPSDTVFCVVWTPLGLRKARLQGRASKSKRQWTPGLHSARESALPLVIHQARKTDRCIFVRNLGAVDAVARSLLLKISPA